jgi:Planctomycete cytochrome C
MGGLLLDSRAGMLRGGKSCVPAIVHGKPEESLLLGAVLGSNKDLRMPPGKTLQPEEIEHLAIWIKMGTPDPRAEAALPVAPSAAYDWEKAKQHSSRKKHSTLNFIVDTSAVPGVQLRKQHLIL